MTDKFRNDHAIILFALKTGSEKTKISKQRA